MSPGKRWLALNVRSPSVEGAELLAEGLVLLGGRAVQETDEGYTTYVPEPANLSAFLGRARSTLQAHAGTAEVSLNWWWQEHEEWEELWRRGLGPRRVTGRIVVTPTWKEPPSHRGDLTIRLDPGMAFGTAEHATTRGCLRLMEPALRRGERVLDVGTGSGILAIAAALLGAGEVVAVESDRHAFQTALENVEGNGVSGVVKVIETTAAAGTLEELGNFEGALANLETPLLLPLIPTLQRVVTDGGWIVLSGILASEEGAILQAAGHLGLKLEAEDREDEWWSALFKSLAT